MQYFGSSIVEGVAESRVKAEMSWVEVDGAEWRWVHGLVIPIMILNHCKLHKNYPAQLIKIGIINNTCD